MSLCGYFGEISFPVSDFETAKTFWEPLGFVATEEVESPYLHLPLQFAASLRPALLGRVAAAELDRLLDAARTELADPNRWGVTFTLVQAWGRVPGPHA